MIDRCKKCPDPQFLFQNFFAYVKYIKRHCLSEFSGLLCQKVYCKLCNITLISIDQWTEQLKFQINTCTFKPFRRDINVIAYSTSRAYQSLIVGYIVFVTSMITWDVLQKKMPDYSLCKQLWFRAACASAQFHPGVLLKFCCDRNWYVLGLSVRICCTRNRPWHTCVLKQ